MGVADCMHLPYRSAVFDSVISIAVIHHLSTIERRVQAVQELCRVTRPGGSLLVYVWAFEQDRKKVIHFLFLSVLTLTHYSLMLKM